MSRLGKRATVYIDGRKIRNVPVYTVEGVEGIRDVVVSLDRVYADSVEEMPEVVDVEWTGYEYVAEFEGVTDEGNPIYSFELDT